MTRNEITRRFPNASPAFIKANLDNVEGLPPSYDEPVKRDSLVSPIQRETESCVRFKIRFTIYACRPADWDGWHIKELQDLLIHAGCLVSDKWSALEGEVLSRKVKTEKEQRTVIEIERL